MKKWMYDEMMKMVIVGLITGAVASMLVIAFEIVSGVLS